MPFRRLRNTKKWHKTTFCTICYEKFLIFYTKKFRKLLCETLAEFKIYKYLKNYARLFGLSGNRFVENLSKSCFLVSRVVSVIDTVALCGIDNRVSNVQEFFRFV